MFPKLKVFSVIYDFAKNKDLNVADNFIKARIIKKKQSTIRPLFLFLVLQN